MTAAWIEALAAFVTMLVAGAALLYAHRQIKLAVETRDEISRPYVVAYFEPSEVGSQLIDLVIKNFGPIAAYDIEIAIEPQLVCTSGGTVEPVDSPSSLSVLVPGQAWTSFIDSGPDRYGQEGLTRLHNVKLEYRGPASDRRFKTDCVLDWSAFETRLYPEVKGIHHLTKEVEKIRRHLESLTSNQ